MSSAPVSKPGMNGSSIMTSHFVFIADKCVTRRWVDFRKPWCCRGLVGGGHQWRRASGPSLDCPARISPDRHQSRRLPSTAGPGDRDRHNRGWLSLESTRLLREKDEHWDILRSLLAEAGTAANLVTDAHLAALAISHGAVLASCDNDFARFRGLRWENPLGDRLLRSTKAKGLAPNADLA